VLSYTLMNKKLQIEEDPKAEARRLASMFEDMEGELAVLKQSIIELKRAAGKAELDPQYVELMKELDSISHDIEVLPSKLKGDPPR